MLVAARAVPVPQGQALLAYQERGHIGCFPYFFAGVQTLDDEKHLIHGLPLILLLHRIDFKQYIFHPVIARHGLELQIGLERERHPCQRLEFFAAP